MPDCRFAGIVQSLRLRDVYNTAGDAANEYHVSCDLLVYHVLGNTGGVVVCSLSIDTQHSLYTMWWEGNRVAVLTTASASNKICDFSVFGQDL